MDAVEIVWVTILANQASGGVSSEGHAPKVNDDGDDVDAGVNYTDLESRPKEEESTT